MHDFDDLCIAFGDGDGDTGENTENRASAPVDAWIW